MHYVFLLLLLLLCSCKSQQIQTSQKVDSIMVHNLVYQDSLHTDFDFQFDQFDVWYYDTLHVDTSHKRPSLLKHICITKGSASSAITKTEQQQVCDSIKVETERHQQPAIKPPQRWPYLVILVLALIALIYIASRLRL